MKTPSKRSSAQSRASGPAKPGGDWPIPTPGDVVSYAYLWAREADAGQEEGLKDRPSVVILSTLTQGGEVFVNVVPVTHNRPDAASDGVEMPSVVKRDLGLDREPSWIMVTEINQFRWPGPDVRLVDGDTPYHGAIPDWLFERVRGAFAGKVGRVRVTRRSE